MQRESVRRGFSLVHQRVVLDLDFSANVNAYTELIILPLDEDLKTINLHCRQCTIDKVTVSGIPSEYFYSDPQANVTVSDPSNVHLFPEFRRKLYSAAAEADEGELSIGIPNRVLVKTTAPAAATPTVADPTSDDIDVKPAVDLDSSQLIIRIDYRLRHPTEGVSFILPTERYPYRVPHVYTSSSCPDAARFWVPCIDNLWERCTWEFQFIVPRFLSMEDDDATPEADLKRTREDSAVVVACCGEDKGKVAHPFNSKKTIWLFRQDVLTSVQHVAFAVGPFHVLRLREQNKADQGEAGESHNTRYPMHAYCLPGLESHLEASTSLLPAAMSYFDTEHGAYPFGSYSVVFVDGLITQRSDGACLSLVSNDLLHGTDAIEQVFETRQSLSHALAIQWAGINIIQKTWSDLWLINGLALYMTGLFFRSVFGNNEYRFRMKKDMDRICAMDTGIMPPMCQPGRMEPPDSAALPFINAKAPVVLHILDRHLGKSSTSLGLSRVLPKIFLSSMTGEMTNNTLSTHSFLRTCRKVSGVDPKSFADQWIYSSGCPRFSIRAQFNRKKLAVEIDIDQECSAYTGNVGDPVALALSKPVRLFEGPMTFRIHEADGTPYEHVLNVSSQSKRYEVPFNTKYRRVRRHTKRYAARQAAAALAAAEGDEDGVDAQVTVDMGFGLAIWDDERERQGWRVQDWNEDEDREMEGSTYEWIRVDADFEWIAIINFIQPVYMWVSQLQRDRDVVAQLEAVHALARMPSAVVSTIFTKVVLVENYFFRIRMEAALALQSCSSQDLDYVGLFHLFKIFSSYCYQPELDGGDEGFRERFVTKPNNFSNFHAYFVKKSLLTAISRCRAQTGESWPVTRRLFLDVLKYNDNSMNAYSDARYLSNVIVSLATVLLPASPPEQGVLSDAEAPNALSEEDVQILESAVAEVNRYRLLDQIVPSQHNVLTIAALEFHLTLMLAGLIPNDVKLFLDYTRDGNYPAVRLVAFDALLLMKWYLSKTLIRYFFSVLSNDSCRAVQRHLARSMCESIAILLHTGEIKSAAGTREPILIEEDGSGNKKKTPKHGDAELMLKGLRKEIGRFASFRECVMPVMLAPEADHEVRWSMIKFADLIFRPTEESLPKLTITLPPTPINEFAPALPYPHQAAPMSALPKIKSIKLVSLHSPRVLESSTTLNVPLPTPSHAVKFDLPADSDEPSRQRLAPSNSPLKSSSHGRRKERQPDKAQQAGMSQQDLLACRQVLKKLIENKHSVLFRQAVDPVRDMAPNYFDIIKDPMDLSTMSTKLEAGQYSDRFAMEQDFRLMIANAHTYNAPGTNAYAEATYLKNWFDKQWRKINNTVDAADKRSTTQRTPSMGTGILEAIAPPSVEPAVQTKATIRNKPAGPPVPSLPSIRFKPILKSTLGKVDPSLVSGGPPASVPSGELLSRPKAVGTKRKLPKVTIEAPTKDSTYHAPPEDDALEALLNEEVDAIEAERPAKKRRVTELPLEEEILASLSHVPSPSPMVVAPAVNKLKGKEKERGSGSPAPTPSARSVEHSGRSHDAETPLKRKTNGSQKGAADPINEKKCREVLKTILKLPAAALFSRPVDPVNDGCPTYFDEIAHPMDFGTMDTKLSTGEYATMAEFAADFDLVMSNCRHFNPPGTAPVQMADVVKKVFQKEWAKALVKKLTYNQKRALKAVLNQLSLLPSAVYFLAPVDPIALGIPTYFDVIPRKNARDLSMIKTKLEQDKYDTVEALEADIQLMLTNAFTFNQPDHDVYVRALQFQKDFEEAIKPHRQSIPVSNGKRKEMEDVGAVQGQSKKLKNA